MEIEYLKNFLLVQKYGSYKIAAEKSFIDPSTLSRQIGSIEKELNIILFARQNNQLELTEQGKLILPYVVRVVDDYDCICKLFNN